MAVEVAWLRPPLASSLHAAWAVAQMRPLADPRLAIAVEQSARQLAADIRSFQWPQWRLWSHLVPLAAKSASRRQIVETAVAKTLGRAARFEQIVSTLEADIAAVDAAVREALPRLADELALRERPLREQWEARGNGLLAEIGRLTEPELIVPQCEVLLVHPALGGGGEAHLAYNSVRIEGVLTNPVAELPEVVRLAWLIAQLQLDLPAYAERIHAERLPHVARYAMLPPALLAAEAVELVRFAPFELARAIAAFGLAVPAGVDAAALLLDWWQTYLQTRPPWSVALAALDQMFG